MKGSPRVVPGEQKETKKNSRMIEPNRLKGTGPVKNSRQSESCRVCSIKMAGERWGGVGMGGATAGRQPWFRTQRISLNRTGRKDAAQTMQPADKQWEPAQWRSQSGWWSCEKDSKTREKKTGKEACNRCNRCRKAAAASKRLFLFPLPVLLSYQKETQKKKQKKDDGWVMQRWSEIQHQA